MKALNEMTIKEIANELIANNCEIPELEKMKKIQLIALANIYRSANNPRSNKRVTRSAKRQGKTTWQSRIELIIENLNSDRANAYSQKFNGKGWLFEIADLAELWENTHNNERERIYFESPTNCSGCFRYGTDWRPSYQTIGRTLLHNGLIASLRTKSAEDKNGNKFRQAYAVTIHPASEDDIIEFLKPVSDECDFDALRNSVKEKARSLDTQFDRNFIEFLSIANDTNEEQIDDQK